MKRLRNNADGYKWARETAQALRAGNLAAVDMEELIDEIESIASGLRREMISLMKDILEAWLVLTYTEADPRESAHALPPAYGQLRMLFHTAPSLQEAVDDNAIDEAYQWARKYVIEDYGIVLPDKCPFPVERILEDPYPRLKAEGKL